MKNMKLKTIKMVLSATLLGFIAGGAQAGHLITFSNGTVANADDVNNNFVELEKRIDELAVQKDPATGFEGKGIVLHTWADFDASLGWISKTFKVTHTGDAYDKEVRAYVRTPNNALSGTIEETNLRTLRGDVVRNAVLSYSYSVAKLTLDQRSIFTADGATLLKSVDFQPGIKLRHNVMGEGINWASAATATETSIDNNVTTVTTTFAIDNRSLLKIEDIIVLGNEYKACQKVLIERTGTVIWNDQKIINWYCPKNVGLVKQIFVDGGRVSKMLEFDPDQSDQNDIVTILPVVGTGNANGGSTTLSISTSEP